MMFKKFEDKNGNGNGPKWKKRINDEMALKGFRYAGRTRLDVNLNEVFKRK